MRTYKIAVMGGDGIEHEVVEAGVQVLGVCAERDGSFTLDFQDFDWGSDYYKKHGVMMPADGATSSAGSTPSYFGAVGAPDVPDHITLWGLRLAICQSLRPIRQRASDPDPPRHQQPPYATSQCPELDWVIVRENSEGEYSGAWRTRAQGPAERGRHRGLRSSPGPGCTRIMRYAFKLAQSRPRKLLTVVTKSNAQRHGW